MAIQKYKDLSTTKKIEHIWEYYRWHIAGTIVGAVALVTVGMTVLAPKAPKPAVDLLVSGRMLIDEEVFSGSQQALRTQYDATIYTLPCNWAEMDQQTAMSAQVLIAKLNAKECDVMAMAVPKFESFLEEGNADAFYPLDTVTSLEPLLEKYAEDLVTYETPDGANHVYGIKVDAMNEMEGMTLLEDYIIGMLVEPKNPEAGIEVIEALLK